MIGLSPFTGTVEAYNVCWNAEVIWNGGSRSEPFIAVKWQICCSYGASYPDNNLRSSVSFSQVSSCANEHQIQNLPNSEMNSLIACSFDKLAYINTLLRQIQPPISRVLTKADILSDFTPITASGCKELIFTNLKIDSVRLHNNRVFNENSFYRYSSIFW